MSFSALVRFLAMGSRGASAKGNQAGGRERGDPEQNRADNENFHNHFGNSINAFRVVRKRGSGIHHLEDNIAQQTPDIA